MDPSFTGVGCSVYSFSCESLSLCDGVQCVVHFPDTPRDLTPGVCRRDRGPVLGGGVEGSGLRDPGSVEGPDPSTFRVLDDPGEIFLQGGDGSDALTQRTGD